MALITEPEAIIFDLGDVLFKWSPLTKTEISPKVLRSILHNPIWYDYERGLYSETECYERISQEFGVGASAVRQALEQARASLVADDALIAFISELRAETRGRLRVLAMSNISQSDYAILRTKPADWSIFDDVFTSGAVGERKPHLGFYRHVIATARINPDRTIFVDDKLENVLSACSLGMNGIVFDNAASVKRQLRNLIGDPVSRGKEYLRRNAGLLWSVTQEDELHPTVTVHENFAQLLILEATKERSLVHLIEHPRAWNFFQGKGQLTTEDFPFDLDTTSLGLTVLRRDQDVATSVMNEMLEYVDTDGIIQTYFDHKRPRFDPIVCVNALCLFHIHGRGAELSKTLEWVYGVLLNRAYLQGTRYYESPECFLFFLSRLLSSSDDPALHLLLKDLLRERVQERIGAGGDALALAMRILVCDYVGIHNTVDLRSLLPLQEEDGGWEIGWIYKYGSSGLKIGNRGLSTALAINAIEAIIRSPKGAAVSRSSALVGKPIPSKPSSPKTPKNHHRRTSSIKFP